MHPTLPSMIYPLPFMPPLVLARQGVDGGVLARCKVAGKAAKVRGEGRCKGATKAGPFQAAVAGS